MAAPDGFGWKGEGGVFLGARLFPVVVLVCGTGSALFRTMPPFGGVQGG